MIPTVKLRNRGSFLAALRAAFLAVTLLIALILGCLAMHSLSVRETPVSKVSTAAVVVQADGANSVASALHSVTGPTLSGCADCAPNGAQLGLAIACVLTLLALVAGLCLPGRLLLTSRRIARDRPVSRAITNLQPRTPSLVALCISRT